MPKSKKQNVYSWLSQLTARLLILATVGGGFFAIEPPHSQAAVPETFDPGNIIDYTSFTAIDSMSVADIQAFLTSKGGYLASYSENGRTAAEIIWGASHGHGDASNPKDEQGNYKALNGITINPTTGTVNPRVLLVTLQKEQSLVTLTSPSQSALNYAMGYGCPDSGGCSDTYKGFTKQVEWAAWQLRYNAERANGKATDYQIGQTMTFSNTLSPYNPPATQAVTLSNGPTAALYRYTPHVYNGNYNFWKFYRQWFSAFQAELVSQSANLTLGQTESAAFEVRIKNTGDATWQQKKVNLGTTKALDRFPGFIQEDQLRGNLSGWMTNNRVIMVEPTVAPGQTATFQFYYTVPASMAPGIYTESFGLVNEGVAWFDIDISWTITVVSLADAYQAQMINRSQNPVVVAGDSTGFEVSFVNTGYVTWKQGVFNLGTDRIQDRVPRFIREDRTYTQPSGWYADNRVSLVQPLVPPGSVGTFRFYYTVPTNTKSGTYREYFRPVAERVKWIGNDSFDLSWDLTVRPSAEGFFPTQWQSQSWHPTLKRGEAHQFTVKFMNNSGAAWKQGVVNLGTDRDQDRVPRFIREDRASGQPSGWFKDNRVQLVESVVPPGSIGTFTFWYTVPADMPLGTYREHFRPVAEGITWMRDWGVYWDITVSE